MVHLRKRESIHKTKSFSELRQEISKMQKQVTSRSVPKKVKTKKSSSKAPAKQPAFKTSDKKKSIATSRGSSKPKNKSVRRKSAPKSKLQYNPGASSRSAPRNFAGNGLQSKIIDELKSIRESLKPTKKPSRAVTPRVEKTVLSEAVKQKCSRETKYALVEWIQRIVGKKTSDEVSHQIGLIESKQIKRKVKKDDKKDHLSKEEDFAERKLKTDQKPAEIEEKKPTPAKSPLKPANDPQL